MLSTTAEYALRIMIALAEADGGPMTSEELSRRTNVSADYAIKILRQLARADMVRAQRGRGGGFRLVCDPAGTTLLDLVNIVDPFDRLHRCPLGRAGVSGGLCAMHHSIDAAIAFLHDELKAVTLRNAAGTLCREDVVPISISKETLK
jgi:Rrf2 family transcriptional regulator, nitric oxide-sensitive transcriptional repressor